MRKTRSWKHNGKHIRKAYGNRNTTRYSSPFMLLDEEMAEYWETEMQYTNTNDGVEEGE